MSTAPIAEVHWPSRQRHRQGQPLMSEQMINVLIRLYNAKAAGQPFLSLAGVHHRSLRTLELRDFVFASKGVDGSLLHKITNRGERVMHAYLRPVSFRDGLCPRCRTNPKRVTASGRREPYCRACAYKIRARQRTLGIPAHKPGRACSDCRQHPVYQFPGGSYSTYCRACLTRRKREEKQRKRARVRARLASGEFVKCQRPGCQNPIYHSENTVYEVCREHWRAYMTRYNDRRRPDSQPARARRYARPERTDA